MLSKLRIALAAATLLALTAVSTIDSASAQSRGEAHRPMLDPTGDNTDLFASTGGP